MHENPANASTFQNGDCSNKATAAAATATKLLVVSMGMILGHDRNEKPQTNPWRKWRTCLRASDAPSRILNN